ncbi:MAG: hypothetical protein ABSH12_00030 [Endomicrobiales bacterium]
MKTVFAVVCVCLLSMGQAFAAATPAPEDEDSAPDTAGAQAISSMPSTPSVQDQQKKDVSGVAPDGSGTTVIIAAPAGSDDKSHTADPAIYKADGFIASKDWTGDGIIVSEKEKKLMISDGDSVFVSLGSDKVSPGTTCTIYRKMDKVINPDTGKNLGIEVRLIGTLEISDFTGKDSSAAKIINARESVEVGDIVIINN